MNKKEIRAQAHALQKATYQRPPSKGEAKREKGEAKFIRNSRFHQGTWMQRNGGASYARNGRGMDLSIFGTEKISFK